MKTAVAARTLVTSEARRFRLSSNDTGWLLMTPALLFLVLLFVVPTMYVLVLSVTDPTVPFDNFRRIFTVPLYLRVVYQTFETSLIVTVVCLFLGYPVAYVLARRDDLVSVILLTIVVMSFWTGFLVRTFAWMVILGHKGPVAGAFAIFGVEPPQLLFTPFASALGITHIMLPFMILALYAVMKKIDPAHLVAASSLGARPFHAFRIVFLPQSLPGVVNGSLLVFTITLGFFVTPILLGTPRDMMIAQLINQQIEDLLAWGFAGAIAVLLLLFAMVLIAVYDRYAGIDRLWG